MMPHLPADAQGAIAAVVGVFVETGRAGDADRAQLRMRELAGIFAALAESANLPLDKYVRGFSLERNGADWECYGEIGPDRGQRKIRR